MLIQRSYSGSPAVSEGIIRGYGMRFYDPADPGTQFMLRAKKGKEIITVAERINPSNADQLIRGDVYSCFNHDANHVLGRQSNGTLILRADAKGIEFAVTPLPDDRVLQLVQRGDVRGASFDGLEGPKEIFRDGDQVVCLQSVESLREIGPVVNPAYKATSVAVRSDGEIPDLSQYIDNITKPQRMRRRLVSLMGLAIHTWSQKATKETKQEILR